MKILWSKILRPGEKWSGDIGRGMLIRFTALDDGANVSILLYNSRNHSEHFNMPDTLKAQHCMYLKRGNTLMSDNGRAMASIVEDTLEWHDAICGYTTEEMTREKYGVTNFQNNRNDFYRNGQDNFITELTRNGLSKRDLVPSVNLFSKISVDNVGNMIYHPDHCKKEDMVILRTEMDILLLLSNTPNPMNPNQKYPSVPVKVEVLPAEPVGVLDYCVNFMPQTRRSFENTWDYYTLLGLK